MYKILFGLTLPARGMKLRNGSIFLLTTSILAAGLYAANAPNPGYKIKIVATTGQEVGGNQLAGLTRPAINDAGDVLYIGAFQSGSISAGLFVSGRQIIKIGDTIGGHQIASFFGYAINNVGEVVFGATESSGSHSLFGKIGAFEWRIVGEGDVVDGLKLWTLDPQFALNDLGEIVFSGEFSDQNGTPGHGIFTPRRLIVKGGVVINHQVIDPGNLALSNLEVFFRGTTASGSTGILTPNREVVKAGDTIGGLQLTDVGAPVVSPRGNLLFEAQTTTGSGLFTERSVVTTAVGGMLGANEAINDRGEVAFVASNALYLNKTVVLSFGTKIGGHTVDGVGDFPIALNNGGIIAFLSGSFDGTKFIVVASPNH